MEISGKITQVLPLQRGTNKNGNEWRKQEFVLETESQYPKKVLIMLWGDKVEQFPVSEGQKVTVSIDLESREYNGRWYTEVRAWKVAKPGSDTGNGNNSNDEEGMPF
ncbi:DUF3127 domain-containing protein [Sphingobacteriales bacterium UPWRP_1]|nr:hypothetical protein BVG80_13850 [Sphingobacteriales bacterium TSM_CSM]PSJ77064.1 DUF3127 domain-containing protein [Sphingobacteriales bacterium UPWRP_1]